MKEKATIYDFARFRKSHCNKLCGSCPLDGENCNLYVSDGYERLDEINKTVFNWCKEHPVKTRQDKFLEMFPDAEIEDGAINICPRGIESYLRDCSQVCSNCRKSYWLAEVEE